MTWTAEIRKKELVNGKLCVGVTYYKGNDSFREKYVDNNPSESFPKEYIERRLRNLNELEDKVKEIEVGKNDFKPEDPLVKRLSPRDSWREKLKELEKKSELANLGVLDEDLTALRDDLKKTYKPEFI